MPHEFLFIIPNTFSRIELISQLHKPEMKMIKKRIHDYDLTISNLKVPENLKEKQEE